MRCSKQRSLKTEQAQPRRRRDALGGSGCRIWGNSHIVHGNAVNTQICMNSCNYIYRYVRMNAVSIQMYVLVLSRSPASTIQHVHVGENSAQRIIVRVITHAKQASRFNVFHVQGNLPALDVITAHIVTLYTSQQRSSI